MLFLILIISFIIYCISLCFFLSGLFKTSKPLQNKILSDISVILCVRNGEKIIENILSDFKNQDYKGNLEFIIIDDNSNDRTCNKIQNFINSDNRFKYFNTKLYQADLTHKKKAISLGINKSKFEWLLFTDVDCRVSKSWVSSIAKYYNKNDFVIGFSNVESNKSFVSKFQSIDFKMLMFSALGSSLHGFSLASSGQNQSYKKFFYKKINGFNTIKNLLQGDDSIFLQLYKKQKNIKISFSEDVKSHVTAKTHNSWKKFILQRIRWAGDANIMWKYNKIFFIIIIATFLTNVLFAVSIIYSFFVNKYLPIICCLVFVKFVFELSLYCKGCKRLHKSIDIYSFLLWFIMQPIYVVVVGLLSFFSKQFVWHGRRAN